MVATMPLLQDDAVRAPHPIAAAGAIEVAVVHVLLAEEVEGTVEAQATIQVTTHTAACPLKTHTAVDHQLTVRLP